MLNTKEFVLLAGRPEKWDEEVRQLTAPGNPPTYCQKLSFFTPIPFISRLVCFHRERSFREAVKDVLFGAPIHLERHSAIGSAALAEVAAVEGGAVEIARPVANYARRGKFPVCAAERVEYGIARRVLGPGRNRLATEQG